VWPKQYRYSPPFKHRHVDHFFDFVSTTPTKQEHFPFCRAKKKRGSGWCLFFAKPLGGNSVYNDCNVIHSDIDYELTTRTPAIFLLLPVDLLGHQPRSIDQQAFGETVGSSG
jgi:hypothetical protein